MMKIGLCLIIFFLLLSQVSARDVCGGCPAIIGETNLTFLNGSAEPLLGLITMQGPTETAGGVEKDSTILSFSNPMDSSGFPLVEATYKYWNATSQKWEVVFQKPRLEAFTTSPEAGEKVTRVARGDNITLEAETNLEIIGSQCKIDYRLVDPQGWIIGSVNGVSLLGQPIDGSGNGKVEIDTTGLQVGSYKLSIETASSCELDAEGGEHAFSIMDLDITLSADKTKQAVTKNVWFSGTTAPFKNIYLNVTAGTGSKVTFLSGYGSYTGPDKTDNISINSSSDGTYSAAARFDEVGYYEITAKIAGTEISSTVSITIEEPSVTVTTEKSSYVCGEDVIIKGTATAGDYVVIAISDEVKTNNTIVKGDGTYEWTWSTGAYVVPAYYTIDVWVCPPTINLSPDSTACWVPVGYDSSGGIQKYEGSGEYMYRDASTTIVIGSPYIEVEVSPAEIAQNDRVKLKGNAPGADYVYYWAFDVNGTTLGGKCISGGIAVSSDGSYEDLIPASVNENTGTITVFAQTFGRDRVYSDGTLSISDYECYHDSTTGNLANKNGAQIVATLEDNVKKAGSDDYEVYKVLTYTVSEPFVSLDQIEDTVIGTNLTISGKTNREDGKSILITVGGPQTLEAKTVSVSSGTFIAIYDTSGIAAGTYTVKADDMEGHTDTETANVIVGTGAPTGTASFTSEKSTYSKGELIKINLTAYNNESGKWVVVVISGTQKSTGYPLAGVATLYISYKETISLPVLLPVPPNAESGDYLLYADIYQLSDGKLGEKLDSYPSEIMVNIK